MFLLKVVILSVLTFLYIGVTAITDLTTLYSKVPLDAFKFTSRCMFTS